jgi:hypothetical protein
MSVKKETQKEETPMYEGLAGSSQTFHAIGCFEAINGTVVLRVPDAMKRINPRHYRDQIYKVDEAIDRYTSTGQQIISFKRYGVRGTDELQDILDDYGAKIMEAIGQLEKQHQPISSKAKKFSCSFELWRAAAGSKGILL